MRHYRTGATGRSFIIGLLSGGALLSLHGTAGAQLSARAPAPAPETAAVEDGDAGVGSIVVTARYRKEDAQKVPIAISAISGDAIAAQGAFTLKQSIQQLPSLNIQGFSGRNQTITIRGIGTNAGGTNDGLEQGVGLYVDGVYRPRTGSVITDLIDVESIQLLRGPQGTLFGKNTVAGAIDIKTRAPDFTNGAQAEASYGNHDYFRGYVSLNAALTDDLAFRVSYLRTSRSGLIRNTVYNEDWDNLDNHSARFDLLYKPTENFRLRFIADYSIQKGDVGFQSIAGVLPTTLNNGTEVRGFYRRAADVGYTPGSVNAFDREVDLDGNQYDEMPSYGFQAQADLDLTGVTLTSITAYRNWKWIPNYDGDQIGADISPFGVVDTDQQQFSQELRIASTGERTIDFSAGLYFFWQEADDKQRSIYGSDAVAWLRTANTPTATVSPLPAAILDGLESYAHVVPATHSYAAYGQATWNISPRFRLTGGLRYTYEHKTGLYDAEARDVTPISALPVEYQATAIALRAAYAPTASYYAKRNTDNLSGTLIAAYDIADNAHAYYSYSRGYKSPGINLVRQSAGIDIFVKPETVDAFELGFKTRFAGGAVELNGALFWTEDRNYQANYVNTLVSPAVSYIANVGTLRSRGVELDARIAPLEGLSATFAATYNDAKYTKYTNAVPDYLNSYKTLIDLSGRQASGAPKWALGGTVDYVHAAGGGHDVYIGADGSYRSSFHAAVNLDPFSRVPGYALFGAHAGIRQSEGKWDLSFWVRNLFDKDYYNTIGVNATYGVTMASIGEPRLYGLTLRGKI
ncbi:TonB-dependent receptor [Sphingobium sp.]|uniref:TonB-dependent receptor n=1 Tax=Sphingobium sp. TaxID=1912891 RepID=UPI002C5CC9C9|nr:TonB-dependent receptor [Sphingobium sp.]HUD90906.1 TonB-dependent receptor [Sphingobium sp.]